MIVYIASAPTEDGCKPNLQSIATWSSSYLSIYIQIVNINDLSILIHDNNNNCQDMFDIDTYNLIDSESKCSWITNGDKINNINIRIDLSSTATIDLSSSITLKSSIFHYNCISDAYPLNGDIFISSINPPTNPTEPNIIISSLPTQIGICDDLRLDARSTTNLGGRDSANFTWTVNKIGANDITVFNEKYFIINSDELEKAKNYNIELTVIMEHRHQNHLIFM